MFLSYSLTSSNTNKRFIKEECLDPYMERIILPNTALCAIVRDELMNPAGGIENFVRLNVPFVEEAIIVDTGSIDGTREALEELQVQYPNLRVVDHKFDGFANSRNVSLKQAKT